MRVWVFASITFLAFEALVFGQAAERKVKVQDVPLAVQQAVKEQGKNATLIGMRLSTNGGRSLMYSDVTGDSISHPAHDSGTRISATGCWAA